MPIWLIVVLIVVALGAVYFLFIRKKAAPITVKKEPAVLNAITDIAAAIPVIGGAAKAAGKLVKPVGKALDTVNDAAISALKHVPIVGNVVAAPLKVASRVGSAISGWLGF